MKPVFLGIYEPTDKDDPLRQRTEGMPMTAFVTSTIKIAEMRKNGWEIYRLDGLRRVVDSDVTLTLAD